MAISPYKTFIAGEVLSAADLNASFTQIINNALSLISPLTGTLDANNNAISNLGALTMGGDIGLNGHNLNTSQGADIASASTIDLNTATGNVVDVTGTTSITTITLSQGRTRLVRFTGILTLTNGASLILPGAADIKTAAGDYAVFVGYASSVVRCASYVRAAKSARLTATAVSDPTETTSTSYVMMGLGATWKLTPNSSGACILSVNGSMSNSTAGAGGRTYATYGTGTAPANGDALTGTRFIGDSGSVSINANDPSPFSGAHLVTGLTVGTAYWIDCAVKTDGTGTAKIADVIVSAIELPL